MKGGLSPEYRLLTKAAAPALSTAAASERRPELDWEEVLRLARRHRLRPLLARYLGETGFDAPGPVLAALARDRRRTAARTLLLRARAGAIADVLSAAGIPLMALKGLVLVDEVYRDVSLRRMVDLDFLVPGHSIQRAEDILLGLGYVSTRPGTDVEPGPRVAKYEYPVLTSADGDVHVDLHRHVLPDARFDVAELWSHARPGGDRSYLLPDGEDLLIHLAAHFFKDRLRRSAGSLGQLADLAWTLHALAIDWDLLVRRSFAYGLHGRVFLALTATDELVAPVPAEVLDALRPTSYSPSVGRAFVERRLLSDAAWHPPGYFGRLPGAAFSRRRRPLRRILPDRAYLEAGPGRKVGGGSSYRRLLLTRARRVAPLLRPWAVYRDARLNRWMRAVAEEGAAPPTEVTRVDPPVVAP